MQNSDTPVYLNQGAPKSLHYYQGNRKAEDNHYNLIGSYTQDDLSAPYFDCPLTEPNWEQEPFLREFVKNLWENKKLKPITQEEADEFRAENSVIVTGENLTFPVMSIDKLNVPGFIVSNFKDGFKTPTAIQSETWPVMMLGRNLVAQSPTGTGKTMAYLLPTIAHIIKQPKLPYGHGPLAVILVPSRELADQIQELATMMTENMPKKSKKLNILSMIGGKSKKHQFTEIGKGVDLLIASPGRLYDMLISSASHLKHTSLIVLDEADKLVIGMEKEMKIILSQIHPNCQKVIFSATANIPGLHSVVKSMSDPISLTVGESSALLASKSVKQSFDFITENEKLEKLTEKYKDFVPKTDGKHERAIIFCGNRQSVEETAAHLLHNGFNPIAFHLGLSQNERKWVLDEFQSNKTSLLVASHLVARGIDFQQINYIIIKDPPKTLREHAHMVGRTGRNNTNGFCHTFITIGDQKLTLQLARAMKGNEIQEDDVLLDIAKRYEQIEKNKKEKAVKKRKNNSKFEEFDRPVFQRMDN